MGRHSKKEFDLILPPITPYTQEKIIPPSARDIKVDDFYGPISRAYYRMRGKKIPTQKERLIKHVEKSAPSPKEKKYSNDTTAWRLRRWDRTTPGKTNPFFFFTGFTTSFIALVAMVISTLFINLIRMGLELPFSSIMLPVLGALAVAGGALLVVNLSLGKGETQHSKWVSVWGIVSLVVAELLILVLFILLFI